MQKELASVRQGVGGEQQRIVQLRSTAGVLRDVDWSRKRRSGAKEDAKEGGRSPFEL